MSVVRVVFPKTQANSLGISQYQLERLLEIWNPPKVPLHGVYRKRGIFEFRPNYEVKTLENTVAIRGEYEEFQLLDKQPIVEHMRKYRTLHIGLVQVAVKPLTATGLNCSVLVCLRDRRVVNFSDSLLAVAQSGLSDGPIYFNCHPSHSVSLYDPNILQTLKLTIKTDDFPEQSFWDRTNHIAVFYRVYYRVTTDHSYESKDSSSSESARETTYIETNLMRNDKVGVAKTIHWDSFEVPERWNVSRAEPS